jgi:hypothetical protein
VDTGAGRPTSAGHLTRIFLSYASPDSEIALRVAGALRAAGAEVFYYEDDQRRGQNFIGLIEGALEGADLFVALISPAYLGSPWCQKERDLALVRENGLRRQFVYVFHAAETPYASTGFLRTIDWVDLLPPVREDKLRRAVATLALDQQRPAIDPERDGTPQPRFHNRRDEIARVVDSLTRTNGQDRWLVLAPPRMGKSWFLDRVAFDLKARQPDCQSHRVDLRAYPHELRSDWGQLLCTLLNVDPPRSNTLTPAEEVGIATKVSRRSCLQLCLLDSAELMTPECVEQFRRALTSIYQHLDRAGNPRTRLGIVVASRHQREWRGFGRSGRSKLFETLPLKEFGVTVVRQAVDELGREFGRNDLELWAQALHALSEGLPALLVEGLRWAQDNEFLVIDQCTDETAFSTVARPYIAGDLLAIESLLPLDDADFAPRKKVLERALRAITPYRLFTVSHLKYHLAADQVFAQELTEANWTLAQLWEALGRTALLKQPSEEIWHVLNPPIRRLLYRYYYPDLPVRLHAHAVARRFYDGWADRFDGPEQGVVLLECLWHEATTLLHEQPTELARLLLDKAVELTRLFVRPVSYTAMELVEFVRNRMQDDTEFATLVSSSDRLFENVLASIGDTIAGGA